MDLSVIIVNWNTRDLLANCLRSLEGDSTLSITGHHAPAHERRTHEPGDSRLSTEVWVVDNASSDGSAEMVRRRFPWVQLIENDENIGFSRANNQAIRRSTGRYVLLLNPDTEPQTGALQTLVRFLQEHPSVGAAGARLLNPDGSLQPSCHPMLTPGREFWRLLFLEGIWPRATYAMQRWEVGAPRQVEVIKGACLLLRRQALADVGLLDDGYFMYTEEVDLCYRLARAGWQLWWVPQAQVVHHEAQSTRQAAQSMYVQLYNSKVRFYRKFGGSRRARQFKCFLFLAYWPRLAAAALAAPVSTSQRTRARTYRRLLAELPGM